MDVEKLAEQLYPLIRARLVEELRTNCVHQYVLSSAPRRYYTTHETWFTYEFFCEHCLDVKHKTKVINKAGKVSWRDY